MIFLGTLFAFLFLFFALLNAKLKKEPSSQGTDVISKLPDDILISIVARLPIKHAIRMSILSSRWRYLHRSLSNLSFFCVYHLRFYCVYQLHDPKVNVDSLNRFLRLRSGCSKINNFRINCCLNYSVIEGLKQAIHSLGRLGVEKLALECCCNHRNMEFSFPLHLLSELPSLRYCGLSSCTLEPSLRSHCSSLQMLELTSATIPPGAIECILSNCLSLEELVIAHCECPSKLCLRAPNLKLKFLRLVCSSGVEEIELYASNLQVFEFTHQQVISFVFHHVPLLQTVYLDTFEEDVVPYVARKLAKDVPNLKSLNLIAGGDKYTASSSRYLGFHMLTNLRRFDVAVYSQTDLPLVIALLKSCPLLQELHLHLLIVSYFDCVEAQGEKQAIVHHSELKKMEISGFNGTENVMELALCILRSATRLEEMRISRCVKIYKEIGWGYCEQTPWSEETSKMIHTRLQGQAVSDTAKLIIQHEAKIEDPLWDGARESFDVSFISI